MLLIQRLTSILLCFVLFILKGISAADIEGCQNAVTEIFRATSSSLANLKDDGFGAPILDYYFIPDSYTIWSSENMHDPVELVIRNPVYFETEGPDFLSVEFAAVSRDGKGGRFKFVCKRSSCSDSLSTLKKHIDKSNQLDKPDQLICLKEGADNYIESFISLTDENKFEATVFGEKFIMFDINAILSYLLRSPSSKQVPFYDSFFASQIMLNEDNKMVIFGDVNHKVVAQAPLPQPLSSVALEYIEAAIIIVNCRGRALRLDKKNSESLKSIIKPKVYYRYKDRSDDLKAIKPREY